jgi:hypothetical protein
MLRRLAEGQHEGFAAAVDAVERLGRDCNDRSDIDDGAAAFLRAFGQPIRRNARGEAAA